MNYFELFDLEPAFDIDSAALQQRYRRLQQQLHPDRFASGSERDKLMAMQRTSQVNDGYHKLRSPLTRAEHLLEIRGVELAHEQRTLQDSSFLMKQMELREQLEEITSAKDILAMDTQLEQEIEALESELREQLNSGSDNDNEAAADTVRKLKFMHKLRDELERAEDTLV